MFFRNKIWRKQYFFIARLLSQNLLFRFILSENEKEERKNAVIWWNWIISLFIRLILFKPLRAFISERDNPIKKNYLWKRLNLELNSSTAIEQVSISSTFYEQLFRTKVFWAAFSYKSLLSSFSVLTFQVCTFLVQGNWCKSCT